MAVFDCVPAKGVIGPGMPRKDNLCSRRKSYIAREVQGTREGYAFSLAYEAITLKIRLAVSL